ARHSRTPVCWPKPGASGPCAQSTEKSPPAAKTCGSAVNVAAVGLLGGLATDCAQVPPSPVPRYWVRSPGIGCPAEPPNRLYTPGDKASTAPLRNEPCVPAAGSAEKCWCTTASSAGWTTYAWFAST